MRRSIARSHPVAVLLLAVALALTGCGAVAVGAVVRPHGVSFQTVPGRPFGVSVARDGRDAFVAVQGRVLIYALDGSRPRLIHSVRLPGGESALGSSLTRDGRLLLVADGEQGATVISVARAERGEASAVLGTLAPPASAHLGAGGAIETASSADGRYVFVSLEYGQTSFAPTSGSGSGAPTTADEVPSGAVAVYDLGSDSTPHFGAGDYRGAIPLGVAVVGSALSPDGRYLYVTSEVRAGTSPARLENTDGTLSVISVVAAERDPNTAVLANVDALNEPVRVAVAPDGDVVWVTARGSNRVLGFSTSALLSSPSRARVADVLVGTAPVGVAVFDGGRRLLVADSDRFLRPGRHAALSVVNTAAALAHRPAVTATLRAGQFPREIAIERNGAAALVTNFGSGQLESVGLAGLG